MPSSCVLQAAGGPVSRRTPGPPHPFSAHFPTLHHQPTPHAAFYDGPMLLTSLNVVKNFVLLGDVQHSVQFVRYRDEVGATEQGVWGVTAAAKDSRAAFSIVACLLAGCPQLCAIAACPTMVEAAGPPAQPAVQGLQPR